VSLNLAETSVVESTVSPAYGANLLMQLLILTLVIICCIHTGQCHAL